MKSHFLSRDLIARNGIDASIRKDAPQRRSVSDAQLIASIERTLAARPHGDVWVFGYGSLLWNPTIRFSESTIATLAGWSRTFCVSMPFGRGTPAKPGLVLGLVRGGTCDGVAFRLSERTVSEELLLLWRREMFADAYVPRWVTLETNKGNINAITFVANKRSEDYAGHLTQRQICNRLATARGAWGTSADYLLRTCAVLDDLGIADHSLATLRDAVFETTALAA